MKPNSRTALCACIRDAALRGAQKGGTLRLTRLVKPKETGKFNLEGTRGNKIDWEMVPMVENLVELGQLPGTTRER